MKMILLRISTELLLQIVVLLTISIAAIAQTQINYQGKLNLNNQPLTGLQNLSFSLYPEIQGGDSVWAEPNRAVSLDRYGIFNVNLGKIIPIPDAVFTENSSLFLQIKIDNTVLQDRSQLFATPFAVRSTYANKLAANDGDPANAVTVDDFGNVGIGIPNANYRLHVVNDLNHSTTTPILGVDGDLSDADASMFLRAKNSSGFNRFVWFTIDPVLNNFSIDRATGNFKNDFVIDSDGKVGIGTDTPSRLLEINGTSSNRDGAVVLNTDSSTNDSWLGFFANNRQKFAWYWSRSDPSGLHIVNNGFASANRIATFKQGGQVGIGIDNPSATLHVRGGARVDLQQDGSTFHIFGPPASTGGGNQLLRLESLDDSGAFLSFRRPGQPEVFIGRTVGGDLLINWNDDQTNEFRFTPAGDFYINDTLQTIHVQPKPAVSRFVKKGSAILNASGEAIVSIANLEQPTNSELVYDLTPAGRPAPNLYIAEEFTNGAFRIAGGLPGQKIFWEISVVEVAYGQ